MGWFTKEEKIHIDRETGEIEREVVQDGRTIKRGIFDRVERTSFDEEGNIRREVQQEGLVSRFRRGSNIPVSDALLAQARAEKKQAKRQYHAQKKEVRTLERKAYKQEFDKARAVARIRQARQRGRTAGRRLPSYGSYSIVNNYNPFGSLFDTGMTAPPVSRPKTKKGKKGKKKGTKKTSTGFGSFDPFDNWGFMK